MKTPVRYWKTKVFQSREKQLQWEEKNKDRYQMQEIFINNSFGTDYRPLLKIDFPPLN